MSRTVTLIQLRTDIAAQCDFSTSAAGRYPPTILNRLINQSIQRFRERISNEGMTHFLVAAPGTLPAGATASYAFQTLDLSALNPGLVRTYGIDITVAGVVVSLAHRPFQERNDFTSSPTMTGQPRAWAHFQTTSVAIMPAPDTAYPYTVWYLPVLADLVSDSDTFDGVAGWEIWVMWDCVCQLIARDQYATAYTQAIAERDIAWTDIVRSATKVSSAGGAVVGRDTMGQAGLWGRQPMRNVGATAGTGGGTPALSSVTNAMLINRNGPIVLGRISTLTGPVEDTAISAITPYLSIFAGSAPGLVPSGTGNSADSLRGDGTWGNTTSGASGMAVTSLAPIPSPRLLGRVSAGSGPVEVLVPTAVATLFPVFNNVDKGLVPGGSNGSKTTFLRGDGAWGTPSGFGVDSLAPIESPRIIGRFTAGSGAVEQLVGGQVASMLPNFDTTRGGIVPYPSGIAGKFLKDDGTWATPASSGGGTTNLPGGPTGSVQYNAGSGVFGGASGFLWDGTTLQRTGNLEMPTGAIRLAAGTGYPAAGFLRFGTQNVDVVVGRSSAGLDAQLMQWGVDGADVLTLGRNTAVGKLFNRSGEEHRWLVGNVDKASLDVSHLGLKAGMRLGLPQMAFPTGAGDKLAGWTASGFANIATGISIVGSGQGLAFGANPAASGTIRLTDFQDMNWLASDGYAKRIIGVGGKDVSFGDGIATGLGDNYYDVAAQGQHIFRTKFVSRATISASGLIMQGAAPLMRAGASGGAAHASGFSIGENRFSATDIFLANAAPPSAVPSGGGRLFLEAGALKYYGPSGTITTLGAA